MVNNIIRNIFFPFVYYYFYLPDSTIENHSPTPGVLHSYTDTYTIILCCIISTLAGHLATLHARKHDHYTYARTCTDKSIG